MSIIHVNQIKTRVESLFKDKIDLSDVDKGKLSPKNRENFFLTRALAAYAIHVAGHVEPDQAAAAVTDGSDDNGIDALHYDEREKRLYIVQSKWIHDGKGEPDNGEVKKFVSGIRDLFDQSFDRFGSKIKAKRSLVNQALSDPSTKYHVILAYTGSDGLAEHSTRDLQDLVKEMNDTSEVVFVDVMRQKELHTSLITALSGEPITLDVHLLQWGKIDAPHVGYYGQVNGREIAQWWKQHGPLLFAKNLRGVLGDTEVNDEIRATVEKTPKQFWYYNNGVTLISNKVERVPAGGMNRDQGTFRCENVSVVNGAQTVSGIGKHTNAESKSLDELYVQLRVISLEGADGSFGEEITKTNNRQNRIDNRDFVSLDPEQTRLRNELAIDGVQYHLLRSESATRSESSLDLVESTTALACASGESGIVVQLKRELGKLWENLEKPPYRALFNPSVSGLYVWRCVQVQRVIDRVLEGIATELASAGGRPYGVAVHGNRLIAALAFLGISKKALSDPESKIDETVPQAWIEARVKKAYEATRDALEQEYPGSIIPTLFKNASKCKNLFEKCGKLLE